MTRILMAVTAFAMSAGIAAAGPNDYFSEKVKDFGVSPRGPVLTHFFFVTNTSKQNVTLGQPRVSCGCTSAHVYQAVLKPGESTAVAAYMDTRRITYSNSVKAVTVYVPFLQPTFEEVQLK